jgi:hypothetical protein
MTLSGTTKGTTETRVVYVTPTYNVVYKRAARTSEPPTPLTLSTFARAYLNNVVV